MLRDFIFPNVNWTCDSAQSSFLECVKDFGLNQLNDTPSNTCGNILDLVFTNSPVRFSNVEKLESDFKSDHKILTFCINLCVPFKTQPSRCVYNCQQADFPAIKRDLFAANLLCTVPKCANVNDAWDAWYCKVSDITESGVSKLFLKNKQKLKITVLNIGLF